MNLRMHQLTTLVLLGAIGGVGFWLGERTQWGNNLSAKVVVPPVPEPQPTEARLLPGYQLLPPTQTAETAFMPIQERTLFSPSRALAPPPAVPVPPAPTMRKGQFVLTGAIVAGEIKVAYLRELSANKTISVRQGEAVNGITIAEIEPRKVVLKQFDDSEELLLNIGQAAKFAPAIAMPAPIPVAAAPGMIPGMPSIPGQPAPGFPQMPPQIGAAPGQPFNPVFAGVQPPVPLYPQAPIPVPGQPASGQPQGAAAAAGVAAPGQPAAGQPAEPENPRARRRMWQNAQ
jgi:hypothetical protein